MRPSTTRFRTTRPVRAPTGLVHVTPVPAALVPVALGLAGLLLLVGCGDRAPAAEDERAPDLDRDMAVELVPGVSTELARARAERILDVRYDLFFAVPGGGVGRGWGGGGGEGGGLEEPVHGSALVQFYLRDAASPLVLDFDVEPEAVRSVRVNGRDADWTLQDGHLVIPSGRLRRGENEVRVEFLAGDGSLNRSEEFLYTLFVPDRAHRAFPGFDQPDMRARFRLTLSVPRQWVAVSNTAGERLDRVPAWVESAAGRAVRGGVVDGTEAMDGTEFPARRPAETVLYRFAETEPIPTYLFAFAAGRFQVEEAERDGRRMRLYHRETDEVKVARNREAIFDLHARALAWMEEYTGIPYPFGKFDFVAVPAFQYNGMEHPGAILYRSESLFLDPSATRTEELGRASVIAHETAHMWFGNLVTMPWFDDVWMKEVFANFMAAQIVHPFFPEIDHDLRFLLTHHPAAYAVDRTAGANPIRQELENLSEAGTLYGPIIYRKAPVVMRQLELLVGEDALRDGLREYLSRHAFGNAAWPDLIEILDGLTDVDLRAWSRVWVEEPGRPWVRLELEETAGRITSMRAVQIDPAGRDRLWTQRLVVHLAGVSNGLETGDDGPAADERGGERTAGERTAGVRSVPVLLDAPCVEVPGTEGLPRPRYALPDGSGAGYGLFLLDPVTRQRLLQDPAAVEEPVARAAAWLSVWDEMLEGAVGPLRAMDVALRLAVPEEEELLVDRTLTDMATIWWRYLSPVQRWRRARHLEEILWSWMHAAETASMKATYLEGFRAVALSPQATWRMRELWSGERVVPGLELSERDRIRLAWELALREAPGWEAVLDRQAEEIENPDRRARFEFVRPAADADPAVRDAFFASLESVDNRRREPWVLEAVSLLHHPLRADASRGYLRPSLEMLEEIRRTGDIFFPERWVGATLEGHVSPEAAEIVRDFLENSPDLPPRLRQKVLQAADLLFRSSGVEPLGEARAEGPETAGVEVRPLAGQSTNCG